MAKRRRRGFGNINEQKSGRFRAQYDDPDGRTYISKGGKPQKVRHPAPHTFVTRLDAEAWLVAERRLISEGTWTPPADRTAAALQAERERQERTFGAYAEAWMRLRRSSKGRPLAATTTQKYRGLLDNHLLPAFSDRPLTSISRQDVRDWHASAAPQHPTARAHAYNLLHAIMESAEEDELVEVNPVRIRGAGQRHAVKKIRPATLDELANMVAIMRPERRLMLTLATWCTLRYGEVAELRRKDVELGETDEDSTWIHVTRAVTWVRVDEDGKPDPEGTQTAPVVGPPKSDAGERWVAVPPNIVEDVRRHLREHVDLSPDALLFPGPNKRTQLGPSTFRGRRAVFDRDGNITRTGHGFLEARRVAGRDDLDFHHLRNTAASMAAEVGASIPELMARLGHSTPSMSLKYARARRDRDAELARRLATLEKPG